MFTQSLLKKKQPTHKSFVKHWLQGFSSDLGRKILGWGCGSILLCLGAEVVCDLGKAQTDDCSFLPPTPHCPENVESTTNIYLGVWLF